MEFQESGRALYPAMNYSVMGLNFHANGLTPHTNYTFRVAGVNSNGTGPFTDIITISTNEDCKPCSSNVLKENKNVVSKLYFLTPIQVSILF